MRRDLTGVLALAALHVNHVVAEVVLKPRYFSRRQHQKWFRAALSRCNSDWLFVNVRTYAKHSGRSPCVRSRHDVSGPSPQRHVAIRAKVSFALERRMNLERTGITLKKRLEFRGGNKAPRLVCFESHVEPPTDLTRSSYEQVEGNAHAVPWRSESWMISARGDGAVSFASRCCKVHI
jgi:hypothetical protein